MQRSSDASVETSDSVGVPHLAYLAAGGLPSPAALRPVCDSLALRREVEGQASGMPTTPTPPSRTGQDPFSVIRLSRSPGWHASVRLGVRSDDFSKSTHADSAPTPCGPSPCPPHYRQAVRVLCPLRHRIPRGT